MGQMRIRHTAIDSGVPDLDAPHQHHSASSPCSWAAAPDCGEAATGSLPFSLLCLIFSDFFRTRNDILR